MAAERINVLIVDDSLAVRALLRKVLENEPNINEIYSASNGKIGLEFHNDKKPDIVILDMNMPQKNGLEVITELRAATHNTPVILFSTAGEAPETIKALQFKKVDFVAKDENTDSNFGTSLDESVKKIKLRLLPKLFQFFSFPSLNTHFSTPTTSSLVNQPVPLKRFKSPMNPRPDAVVIASSTGGPRALEELFLNLHQYQSFKPIFIVQHMPPNFTAQLAEHLTKKSGLKFSEARNNQVAEKNNIYIAPGGYHLELREESADVIKMIIHQKEMRHSVRPSAEYLFESASPIFKNKLLTIVLTGMGDDGIDGSRIIKKNYGKIITQTADSCAVYGMPKAIDDAGLSDGSENIENIRQVLIENFLKN